MLTWAAVLLGLTALGGVAMAVLQGRGVMPPLWLAAGHGLLAVAGMVFLGVYAAQGVEPLPVVALVLFIVAAVGGLELLRRHLRQGTLPLSGVLGHGAVAVVAFIFLLVVLI